MRSAGHITGRATSARSEAEVRDTGNGTSDRGGEGGKKKKTLVSTTFGTQERLKRNDYRRRKGEEAKGSTRDE